MLDIGSGPGFLCAEMARAVAPGGEVRGIDVSADMIRRSQERNADPCVGFAEGDACALDEHDGAWDAVVSTQLAEYLPDIDAFCREMHRVVRLGGRGLVLATDWDAVI